MAKRIVIIFLSLPSPDLAIARVRTRVAMGGHGVPEEVIRRRFGAGLSNSGTPVWVMVKGEIIDLTRAATSRSRRTASRG